MIEAPKIEVGDSLTVQKVVNEHDTGLNYGTGKLNEFFAMPSLLALMIEASTKLLDDDLPEGFVTVGYQACITHEMPSMIGDTISVKVEIKNYDGNKIDLDMIAYDEIGIIGKGSHTRAVVNKTSLMKRAEMREQKLKTLDY